MSSISFIYYNAQHYFILCKINKYALLPNTIAAHFNKKHYNVISPANYKDI